MFAADRKRARLVVRGARTRLTRGPCLPRGKEGGSLFEEWAPRVAAGIPLWDSRFVGVSVL